jgi:hypothetical protein
MITKKMFYLKTKSNGQSLTEYSLVIGLVALASIAGVAVLSTSIQQNMTQSFAQDSAPLSTDPALVSQNLSAPSSLVNAGPGGTRQALPTQNLCISGLCANFPLVGQGNDLVDVAAGEGADRIHQFASVYEQLALALESSPNPDPQLAALIREAALKGHEVGDKQAFFLSAQSAENGNTYQISQSRFRSAQANLNQYLASRRDSINPTLSQVLSVNTQQIIDLGNAVSVTVPRQLTSITTRIAGQNAPDIRLIHQSADTICGQQSQQDCIRNTSGVSAVGQ